MTLRSRSLLALLAGTLVLGAWGTAGATPHAEAAEATDFVPRPFTAIYDARYGSLSGSLTLRLRHVSGDEWEMSSELRPRGLARGLLRLLGRSSLVERSRLRLTPEGIVSLTYERDDGISGPDHNAALEFHYDEAGRVVGVDREESVDLPLDRLSIQLQLMRDLTHGLRREEYHVVDRAEVREMDVVYVDGRPIVRAAGEEFRTIALDHRSRTSSRSTRLWCAQEYQFLPVRIEQTRDGRTEWSGVLREVQWGEPPAS